MAVPREELAAKEAEGPGSSGRLGNACPLLNLRIPDAVLIPDVPALSQICARGCMLALMQPV